MKNLFRKLDDALAQSALLEMGVWDYEMRKARPISESLEENLVEVAYAEAGDYDDIRRAAAREKAGENKRVGIDECQYGDNDVCFAQ